MEELLDKTVCRCYIFLYAKGFFSSGLQLYHKTVCRCNIFLYAKGFFSSGFQLYHYHAINTYQTNFTYFFWV